MAVTSKQTIQLIKSFSTYASSSTGDEEWQQILIKGELFIKHHKYTSAKLRHIWLSDDLFTLYWKEPSSTSIKPKGSIKIIEISNIKLGLVKARKIKKKSENQRLPYIFSIITPKRTLELEASSIVNIFYDTIKNIGYQKLMVGAVQKTITLSQIKFFNSQ